jgi:opacity protein-like surface antigen
MARPKWQICCPAVALVILNMGTVGATLAAAQSASQPRVEISANVGALTGASKFRESEAFPANAETETLTVNHGVKTAVGFDVGGAVRIVSQLWVGVQYAMADTKASASITAIVPHPLQFNAPRTVQGSINGVAHTERNVHVDLMYALPVPAVDVKVMAGPTFFNLKQDFVSGVTVNETYPFDTATFASATTTRLSKAAVGFNAGVDISRPLSSQVAVGALIRYSRANVKFDGRDTGQQTVKAGGVEAAAGVRVRF